MNNSGRTPPHGGEASSSIARCVKVARLGLRGNTTVLTSSTSSMICLTSLRVRVRVSPPTCSEGVGRGVRAGGSHDK